MVITVNILKEKYKDYSNPLDKIRRDVSEGKLHRLTNGLYETERHVDPCFLAPHIVPQSYISFDYALSYYGLIPERVVAITSASFMNRKNKTFRNVFGRFEYSDVPAKVFSEGLTYINYGEYYAKIAMKEKAICDSLYKWPVVHSVKDLKVLMFEDKRMDEDEFASCDFDLLIRLASMYHNSNHKLLVKMVQKEYMQNQ